MRTHALAILLFVGLPLIADVQYDSIRSDTTFSNIGRSAPIQGAPVVVSDIPSNQYIPPALSKGKRFTLHIEIKGDRLLLTRPTGIREIYNLADKTITIVDDHKKSYTIKTFDDEMRAENAKIAKLAVYYGVTPIHKIMSRDTGETRQIDGQTATRHDLLSIAIATGHPTIDGSLACWVVEQPVSSELDAFRAKWAQLTDLSFPDGAYKSLDSTGPLSTLVTARDKFFLGKVVDFVLETRPWTSGMPGLRLGINSPNPQNGAYDASSDRIAPNDPGPDGGFLFRHEIFAMETALANFTNDPVSDDAFAIPSTYKRKEVGEPKHSAD